MRNVGFVLYGGLDQVCGNKLRVAGSREYPTNTDAHKVRIFPIVVDPFLNLLLVRHPGGAGIDLHIEPAVAVAVEAGVESTRVSGGVSERCPLCAFCCHRTFADFPDYVRNSGGFVEDNQHVFFVSTCECFRIVLAPRDCVGGPCFLSTDKGETCRGPFEPVAVEGFLIPLRELTPSLGGKLLLCICGDYDLRIWSSRDEPVDQETGQGGFTNTVATCHRDSIVIDDSLQDVLLPLVWIDLQHIPDISCGVVEIVFRNEEAVALYGKIILHVRE